MDSPVASSRLVPVNSCSFRQASNWKFSNGFQLELPVGFQCASTCFQVDSCELPTKRAGRIILSFLLNASNSLAGSLTVRSVISTGKLVFDTGDFALIFMLSAPFGDRLRGLA